MWYEMGADSLISKFLQDNVLMSVPKSTFEMIWRTLEDGVSFQDY